uniref:Uncharacterized protein n=1 Tax=Arundo donax TaxID=35708 RepID=A0A0A9ENE4_ARUDO
MFDYCGRTIVNSCWNDVNLPFLNASSHGKFQSGFVMILSFIRKLNPVQDYMKTQFFCYIEFVSLTSI